MSAGSRGGRAASSEESRADEDRARAQAEARLRAESWPADLVAALERLRAGGAQAWLIGGCVRDRLLGRAPDPIWDVATSLTPDQVVERFARVEPVGLRHGTVLVLEGALALECTTFRREGGYADARRPDRVEFTADLAADLARRDLTVNALAFDPVSGVLVDRFGGALDLERRVLRAVGDPAARFHEDALRPLRVARLAATLEMDVEDATAAALAIPPERARQVAVERVRDELEKMMTARAPSAGWERLREAGLLALWLPELDRTYGVPQNRFHAYDVWGHSLATCDAAPADKPVVRWAALLHDLGKPATREIRRGDATFYRHEAVGAELADAALRRLRFPNAEREAIVHLVREHMFDYRPGWSDGALRRWLRRVGVDAVADLFDLRIADIVGNGLRHGIPSHLETMRAAIERLILEDEALHVRDLAVDGHDVMTALGVPPGPEVRSALERLLDEVLEDPARNERAALLARLSEWRAERAGERSGP